jgi:hypothetical protein
MTLPPHHAIAGDNKLLPAEAGIRKAIGKESKDTRHGETG